MAGLMDDFPLERFTARRPRRTHLGTAHPEINAIISRNLRALGA
jgi:hypothetical protein